MKNVKKIGLALLLVAVLVAGIVVAAFASDYKGNVEKYTSLVEKAVKASTIETKDAALKAVEDYLISKPVDPAEEGYDKVSEDYMAAKIAMVELCIATEAADVAAKVNNSTIACKWFDSAWKGVDTAADERYAPLAAKLNAYNVEVATTLSSSIDQDVLAKADADIKSAEEDAKFKAFKSFCDRHFFLSEDASYVDLSEKLAALVEVYNTAKAARYEAIVSQAKITDYDRAGAPVTNFTFEKAGVSLPSVSNSDGYDKLGLSLKNTYATETQVLADGTTNTYFALHLNGAMNAAATSYVATYINPTFSGLTDKFTLEFDITSFGSLPNVGIGFQPKSGETWFEIDAKGNFKNKDGKVLIPNMLVVGEWTHISVVCELDNMKQSKLYVDYNYIGALNTNPSGTKYTPSGLRIGNKGNSSGDICIDNFKVTATASIVDTNYVSRMSEMDQFLYLTDYMQRINADEEMYIRVPDCIEAYNDAAELSYMFGYKDVNTGEVGYTATVENIEDAELKSRAKAAVDAFFAYDSAAVAYEYSVNNLIKLESLVKDIEAAVTNPSADSISKRNTKITAASSFDTSNANYIYKEAVEGLGYTYETVKDRLAAATERLAEDQAIKSFVDTMANFDAASSATLLQSLYDKATAMIGEGLNLEHIDGEGYEDFKKHYEITYVNGPAKIELAKKNVNSSDLIDSINYLLGLYPTEAEWKLVYIENPVGEAEEANNRNYEFIRSYVDLINRIISRGDYNPDYVSADKGSVDFAIQRFSAVRDYYYDILQDKHIEVISEQFELFAATSSYIEKKGIVSYIQRYLNQEEVDFSVELTCENQICPKNGRLYTGSVDDVAEPSCPECGEVTSNYRLISSRAELYTLLKKYTAYEAELAPQEGDYNDLLAENTVYFVNTVKRLDTAITFADKVAIMDQARAFYYAMNIDTDEAKAAVAEYEAIEAELLATEKDSIAFVDTVLLLATSYEDDVYYRHLVTAASLRDKIDESIEGVGEAVDLYEAAYNEYMSVVNNANSEINKAGISLGSFGANSGFSAVLSVILRILFAK